MLSMKQIEKKYHVRLTKDVLDGEYRIYSADGCPWENGMYTLKAVIKECETWRTQLKEIAVANGV